MPNTTCPIRAHEQSTLKAVHEEDPCNSKGKVCDRVKVIYVSPEVHELQNDHDDERERY